MKKKVIGVLLATAMAFGLAACGNSAGGEAVKQETEKAEEAKAGTKEEKSGEVTTVTLWSFKAEDNDPTASSSRLKKLIDDFNEYYGTAEPPVRCGESHLSGLTEPLHFVY